MIVFLELNGLELKCTDDELVKLGCGLEDSAIDDQNLMK